LSADDTGMRLHESVGLDAGVELVVETALDVEDSVGDVVGLILLPLEGVGDVRGIGDDNNELLKVGGALVFEQSPNTVG